VTESISSLSGRGHERAAGLHPTDVRSVRRRWHNDLESHERTAFGHPFVAASSPANPRPPALGVCCPTRGRDNGNPCLARAGLFPSPPADPGTPDRGAAPRGAGTAARPARDAAGPQRHPTHAASRAPCSCAASARAPAAERGQAARASASHAGAARARDSTSRHPGSSLPAGGGPGARAVRACVRDSGDPTISVPRASCGLRRAAVTGGRESPCTSRSQERGARPSRALGAVRVPASRPSILTPRASP
jgi:hypothetical protein